jgi:dihydroorotase
VNDDYHISKLYDVLIENGIITAISEERIETSEAQIIEEENLHISIGFFDFAANFSEPGEEYKETIHSGIQAALAGGFTGIALTPNTSKPIDSPSMISFVKAQNKFQGFDLIPYSTITAGLKGSEMVEFHENSKSGAKIFSDYKKQIANSALINTVLEYNKMFGYTLGFFPNDEMLTKGGLINESNLNFTLGLKPIPRHAEYTEVFKLIELAKYNNVAIHLHNISTLESLNLIRKAKSEGHKITCDIALPNLIFSEDYLSSFHSFYKVFPPLRSNIEIPLLIDALKDETIDVICSDHFPQSIEDKQCEFDLAKPGMALIQYAFPLLINKLSNTLELNQIIHKLTVNPRKILNINIPQIAIHANANITAFIPNLIFSNPQNTVYSKAFNQLKDYNNLMGKVKYVLINNELHKF